MKPIYIIVMLVVGVMLTTCKAQASPETVALFGPIEVGTRIVNGTNPVEPWAYSSPDAGLFPSPVAQPIYPNNITIPIPTGNTLFDLLQIAILSFLGWRMRIRKEKEPESDPFP